ncbi:MULTISPECIES: ParB/RepB/Spo0J family partition protein [unclassified Breznakia]|uniref:ParB/RepB/Spo0J family partition protein n=1 Tax=unclassified Breznakia TaxID=2623764 RepID=UPI002473C43F|nr:MULTISPECIES: ParB/RepB/Spo0J family partition protein [unclassified Breznakia]MDH6367531.1 ParB family chromosome partitioning protein [Breznakia sp. PH1-1]MDH6404675.1 ParB family chromosome partitioning protein [Breznakia sp. PF1-11]MDH6412361.1 ParB family chromosome partitioning protein [Breznakia sp. PFB1-11]MDH6414699.1 ParB family chromosome partitioning protein [Breznakia sp. PFB1-14]MDH6417056.1 ParB family chromosome partitioning protein [Breznakia sp. PFB1-4]
MQKVININVIAPHENNPRVDLGDLTELIDSIKENGILQPITVVEDGFLFKVIMGHRRLAAAKEAGLTELTVNVVEMGEKKQAAAMLLENMTRKDLNAYEQARGFQMCLDLGMDVKEVSKATGFTQKKVKQRVKMLDLDQQEVEQGTLRGATIEDFIKLEEIENEETRNEVLQKVGTKDFEFTLNKAISEEKMDKKRIAFFERLNSFAVALDEYPEDKKMKYAFGYFQTDKLDIPDDANEKTYYYVKPTHKSEYIRLLVEDEDDDVEVVSEPVVDEERIKRQENKKQLEQLFDVARESRKTFVKDFIKGKVFETRDVLNGLSKAIGYAITKDEELYSPDIDLFYELIGKEKPESDDYSKEMFEFLSKQDKFVYLFALFYVRLDLDGWASPIPLHYDGSFDDDDKNLEEIYKFMKYAGYVISAEEQQLLDGTHELYYNEDGEE